MSQFYGQDQQGRYQAGQKVKFNMMNEPNTENLPVQGEQPSSNGRLFSELAKRMAPMAPMGAMGAGAGSPMGIEMSRPVMERQPSMGPVAGAMGGVGDAIRRGMGGSMAATGGQSGDFLGKLMGGKKPVY